MSRSISETQYSPFGACWARVYDLTVVFKMLPVQIRFHEHPSRDVLAEDAEDEDESDLSLERMTMRHQGACKVPYLH